MSGYKLRVVEAEPCSYCPQRGRGDGEFCVMDVLVDDIPGRGYIAEVRDTLIEFGFRPDEIEKESGLFGLFELNGEAFVFGVGCPVEENRETFADRTAGIFVIQDIPVDYFD